MKTNPILETDILVHLHDLNDEVAYDFTCYDGHATGNRVDDILEAPKTIEMEYPTLAEVLADKDKARYILEYRGLYDLNANDIHYGDVMMAYGEMRKQFDLTTWKQREN